jgi:hypothetical protein
MRNSFTSQSLAGMTYYILCTTTKNGGKFPRGIYNIGCKLPITYWLDRPIFKKMIFWATEDDVDLFARRSRDGFILR